MTQLRSIASRWPGESDYFTDVHADWLNHMGLTISVYENKGLNWLGADGTRHIAHAVELAEWFPEEFVRWRTLKRLKIEPIT